MLVKVKILKRHNRAEDCRTVHHFLKDQIISVKEKFANEIIEEGDGILFVENEEVIEEAIIETPEEVIEAQIINEQPEVTEEPIAEEKTEEKIEEVIEEAKDVSIQEEVEIEKIENEKVIEEKSITPEPKFTNKFNPFKKRK